MLSIIGWCIDIIGIIGWWFQKVKSIKPVIPMRWNLCFPSLRNAPLASQIISTSIIALFSIWIFRWLLVVPMTFFDIQKRRVIKKRQNTWKVSKKMSFLIYCYFDVNVLPMRILFSLNWNLNLKPVYTTAKKVFLLFIQTCKEHLVMPCHSKWATQTMQISLSRLQSITFIQVTR